MKKRALIAMTAIFLAGVLLMLTAERDRAGEGFACYTYNHQGQRLDGYRSEQDGVWYLFVTATQELPQLSLHTTEDLSHTSAGRLDRSRRTVTEGFARSGDRLEVTLADGTVHTVAVLQSGLPSVYIDIARGGLEDIHRDKNEKLYSELSIADPMGEGDGFAEYVVTLKGRGNSTWTLADKRGYQVEFEEQTSVLGMGEAKKWILLANAFDDSMMRSQLVYSLAEKLNMAYAPAFSYVDLWIDGDYLGTYLMGEKPEIGSTRLDLSHPTAALFEHDEGFYMEEDHWFYSALLQRHFTLKEIGEDSEAAVAAAMADFEGAVDELAAYLHTTPSRDVTLEALSGMIDVDSFAKYFLINEYVLNRESFVSSFYWYKDGPEDVLHLGPVWDFDSCMGNDGCLHTESYGDDHLLFRYLLAAPAFHDRAEDLYRVYRPAFAAMEEEALVIRDRIADSARMNYLRWDLLGKPSGKIPEVAFHQSFEEAVAGMRAWLAGRAEVFSVAAPLAVTTRISEDCRTLTLQVDDGGEYTSLRFGVRAQEDLQELLLWSDAQRIDGVWRAEVDLAFFNQPGIYSAHAYGPDGQIVASGAGYAEKKADPLLTQRPIYRLHNPNTDERVYTSSPWERDNLISHGWLDEGIGWYAPIYEGKPVYCLSDPKTYDRQYTMDEAEAAMLEAAGWDHKGVCWVSPAEGVPVYRLYNPAVTLGSHRYTASEAERDALIGQGWIWEGIGWYGVSGGA